MKKFDSKKDMGVVLMIAACLAEILGVILVFTSTYTQGTGLSLMIAGVICLILGIIQLFREKFRK